MRKCSPLGSCPVDVGHKDEPRKLSCIVSSLSLSLSNFYMVSEQINWALLESFTHMIFPLVGDF